MRLPLPLVVLVAAACSRDPSTSSLRAAPPPGGPPAAASRASGQAMIPLPDVVGAWHKSGPVRHVDARTIFDYMDGGGELYLAYRFERLEVQEYAAAGEGNIVVEVYRVGSPDDAFGLLSNDWGGEPVDLKMAAAPARRTIVPQARALYGAGLLRFGCGSLYGRILASRETPASRSAVLALGRAIAAGAAGAPVPALVGALDGAAPPGYRLRPDRVCFFRSHLVLNAVYFVSSEDILDLDPSSEAVAAAFEPVAGSKGAGRVQAVLVRYRDDATASRGLARFVSTYLPENADPAAASARAGVPSAVAGGERPNGQRAPQTSEGCQPVEHGWVAYRRRGADLAIVFDAPDRAQATELVSRLSRGMAAVKRAVSS